MEHALQLAKMGVPLLWLLHTEPRHVHPSHILSQDPRVMGFAPLTLGVPQGGRALGDYLTGEAIGFHGLISPTREITLGREVSMPHTSHSQQSVK